MDLNHHKPTTGAICHYKNFLLSFVTLSSSMYYVERLSTPNTVPSKPFVVDMADRETLE